MSKGQLVGWDSQPCQEEYYSYGNKGESGVLCIRAQSARFEEAIHKYSEAVEACGEDDTAIAVAVRNNRAACHQQLSNFDAVCDDTTFVLENDPKNVKALIRRGLALEALERYVHVSFFV